MLEETYRELWKRGQTIFDKTVQGRIVSEKEFEQKELLMYSFRVDNFEDLESMLFFAKERFKKEHLTIEVAKEWLNDMINNETLHENWWDKTEYTQNYFKKFCDEGNGNASYSYGERLIPQIKFLIKRIKDNKYGRGCSLSMTNIEDISKIGHRVPCSLTYNFICRPTLQGDKLNLIVYMRSSDSINFFPLDFARSVLFLKHIAKEVNLEPGFVSMSITSLHAYKCDIPSEFTW